MDKWGTSERSAHIFRNDNGDPSPSTSGRRTSEREMFLQVEPNTT
jgi:hypothetical protein